MNVVSEGLRRGRWWPSILGPLVVLVGSLGANWSNVARPTARSEPTTAMPSPATARGAPLPSTTGGATGDWCQRRLEATIATTRGTDDTAIRRAPPTPPSPSPCCRIECRDRDLNPRADRPAPEGNAAAVCVRCDVRAPDDVASRSLSTLPMSASPDDDVFVAIVPDPTDTSERRLFDEHLAAIRLALAWQGWDLDSQWTPWTDDSFRDPKDAALAAACRLDVPGVLVYRKTATGKVKRLAVLLVGETPTGGVHRHAMLWALDYAGRTRMPSTNLRILGPAFSGGATALRDVLTEWRRSGERDATFEVVSGSANAIDSADVLPESRERHSGDSFARMMTSIAAVECSFFQYLQRQVHVPVVGQRHRLRGVAVLHESGTSFGRSAGLSTETETERADTPQPSCDVQPEIDLRFPIHVASVRGAYASVEPGTTTPIVRRTYLDLPLGEELGADEIRDESSQTATSRDIALSFMLADVATEGVRFLGIAATDVSDAIFLARKIRDIAPDVRLAFFSNDILLVDPEFDRDLRGSFVITPFPFLGSADFQLTGGDENHVHFAFQSDLGEAVFNAALRLLPNRNSSAYGPKDFERAWPTMQGSLVPQTSSTTEPLVWVNAIGAGQLVPLQVEDDAGPEQRLWLHVDEDVTPPNVWQFALAVAAAIAGLEWRQQRARRPVFQARVDEQGREAKVTARRAEMAIVRARHAYTNTIRSSAIGAVLIYLLFFDVLALVTYAYPASLGMWPGFLLRGGVAAGAAAALFLTTQDLLRNRRALRTAWRELARMGKAPTRAARRSARGPMLDDRLVAYFESAVPAEFLQGGDDTQCHVWAARQREVDLATVAVVGVGIAIVLWLQAWSGPVLDAFGFLRGRPSANNTLMILRTLPLLDGVSPASPVLCVIAVVWIWARVHAESLYLRYVTVLRSVDDDDVNIDVMALPLSYIVGAASSPKEGAGGVATHPADRGLQRAEKRLVAVMTSELSSRRYLLWFGLAMLLPAVLFVLKPLSTLEPWPTCCLLIVGLAGGTVLTVLSLVQVALYWNALSGLLRQLEGTNPKSWVLAADDALRHGSRFELPDFATRGSNLSQLARRFTDAKRACREEAGAERLEQMRADFRKAASDLEDGSRSETAVAEGAQLGPELAKLARGLVLGTWGQSLAQKDALIGSYIVITLRRYLRHVGVLMVGIVGQALMLVLCIEVYVFEPKRLLLTCVWGLMLSIVGVALWILVAADRNETLSSIWGGKPGEVDWSWDFVGHVVRWAGVPLLAVAAAEYPRAATAAFAWLAPILHGLQ